MSTEGQTSLTGSQVKEHYRTLLSRTPSPGGGVEGTIDPGEPDLSDSAISDRVKDAEYELRRIIKTHLGDRSELRELAAHIARQGEDALKAVANDDHETLAQPAPQAALEVIVRTDGSRPSFLIANDEIDFTSSPAGPWRDAILPAAAVLERTTACIGRIDHLKASQGFQGTGFLVGPNVILTNRHVLQAIAAPDEHKVWKIDAGVKIDFGHEFRARDSVRPCALKSVLFCAKDPIVSIAIDHKKLDLALIELDEAGMDSTPLSVLSLDISKDWSQPDLTIFTIGYPANPGLTEQLSLLEQLFHSTFGFKRFAPGTIMRPNIVSRPAWTTAHDCTTLGGNSGSVVLVATRGTLACALHYGGRRAEPRENWGHILGLTLDTPNAAAPAPGKDPIPLRALLKTHGVKLIDPQTHGD